MEKQIQMMDNTLVRSGAIAMHPKSHSARYQIGDPGRYLCPGLFQELLLQLDRRRIDPCYGYTIEITDPETGNIGRITGVKTGMIGVAIPDDGERELGCFTSETGHFAIAEMTICVEPDACDQCRWITIDERFTAMSGPGMLIVHGSVEHVRFELPMPAEQHIAIPKAA